MCFLLLRLSSSDDPQRHQGHSTTGKKSDHGNCVLGTESRSMVSPSEGLDEVIQQW